jgi:hypothetical protein
VAVDSSERHFALTTDPLNIKVSPMVSNGGVLDDENEGETNEEVEGYITKLESSSHTQRLEEETSTDRKITLQSNTFQ